MLDIQQLKNAFKTPERDNNGGKISNYYPFWNIKTGEQVNVRFLPDKNPENPMGFLVEKLMHTLIINGEKKSIPCLKMYHEDCPICKVSASYYKAGDKVNGKKYWRKKQHIAQALIYADPLPPNQETNETHSGQVRYLALGYQLFNIIKEAFEGGELDEIPYSFKKGTDFLIKKSQQGEYSTYAMGSKFARKSTDLDDDMIAYVQEQMIDLSTLLPKNPGAEKVQAWLEASLTGSSVDDTSDTEEHGDEAEGSVPTVSTPVVQRAVETKGDDDINEEAESILAQIRSRRATQK